MRAIVWIAESALQHWGGIARYAVQQRQVAAARVPERARRLRHLVERRHPGGEDDRLAGGGAAPQQIGPQELVRGDLEEVDVRHERVDGLEVKRRAAELEPAHAAPLGERREKFDRQLPRRAPAQLRLVRQRLGREEIGDPEQLELDRARIRWRPPRR